MSLPKQERRRRRLHDEGEEVGAETPAVVARSSECESEDESPSIEHSERESVVEDSADQEDETEEGSETETEEGSETEEETGSETEGYTDEEGLAEERQSGDGEEQPDNGKPDDDEDKKNPAYVPRKGAFYEHDFRRGSEGPEVEVKEEAKPKKKLWQDEGKWSHDKYIDDLQAPKSRQELIEIYGYDIRSSDKPPETPPRRQQRTHGPRKQRFTDFIPRMAVIDTTDGGHDSVPNLDEDEFIQYKNSSGRNTHRNRAQNADTRRGRGGNRDNYRGSDIETKNNRNRFGNSRANEDFLRSIDVPAEGSQAAEDFPSLGESAKQVITKDIQNYKRGDNSDRMLSDTKSINRIQKSHQPENDNSNLRDDYRYSNRDKFQQTQDIRRQEDIRGKNRPQQGYKEERREVFNQSSGRDSNFNNNQSQGEKWKTVPNEFKDGYNRGDSYSGNVNDYGYSGRKQQQQPTGGNRDLRAGNSGDAGGYFNNNKPRSRGFEQPTNQSPQPEMAGAANKEAREYTNTSYKYSDVKPKPKNGPNLSAAPTASNNGGDDSVPANSQSVVISNKENVQTINVTITSTTTEKKSYAKERRAKGVSRPVDGAVLVGNADPHITPVAPVSGNPYQSLPPAGIHMDVTTAPLSVGTGHYPPHRQQGMYTEPSLVGGNGAKLYNPSLPPPSFYQRDHGGLPPSQHPTHAPPAMLPPATALPFGLPVSATGLALPPNATGRPTNPAMFQPPTGPPPTSSIATPATAMIAAPFLPAGMMYGGGPRVPPPGTPTAFPQTLLYTSPPPQGTVAAAVVGNQPPPQGAAPAQGIQAAAQHKKVYRGDITYYAPELQQPSRTPQKRPKAAIPIIDPQEVPGQKLKEEKPDQRYTQEWSTIPANKNVPSNTVKLEAPHVDVPNTVGSNLVSKTIPAEGLNQNVYPDLGLESKGRYSSASVFSQGVVMTTSASLQTASSVSSKEVATSQAKYSPLVSQSSNMKSTSSVEGYEHNRMAIKTELSPGGPPVNNSLSNVALLSKDIRQSVSTAVQNFPAESASIKIEMGVSSVGNAELKQDVCERPLTSSSESSVA